MTREYFSRLFYSFPVNVPWEVSGESWQMQIVSDSHSSCCWAAINEAGVKKSSTWVGCLFLVCLSPEQLLIWIVSDKDAVTWQIIVEEQNFCLSSGNERNYWIHQIESIAVCWATYCWEVIGGVWGGGVIENRRTIKHLLWESSNLIRYLCKST